MSDNPMEAVQSPQVPELQPVVKGNCATPVGGKDNENTTPKTAQLKQSAVKETPPAVRQRREMATALHCSSPSDSMLSPCTSKLFGKRSKISSASAILRSKQQAAIPLNLSQSEEDSEAAMDDTHN